MSVDKSSSYGWLDRLAMAHLKKWRFEPLPMGGRNEWGIITLRFFLE
jgi:TonB family protein